MKTLFRSCALGLYILLFTAGCAGGVRVVRSDPTVALLIPSTLALGAVPDAALRGEGSEVAQAFAGALESETQGFTLVRDGNTRYRLDLVDLRVANRDGDTHATLRLALRDDQDQLLDEVEVSAIGHDPGHAGREVARHFGRYLAGRDNQLD